MNNREQAQLLIILGFAAGHGCDFNIQSVIHTLTQKRKKVSAEKEELLRVFDFAKDQGITELFSSSELQILESAIKYEI